MKQLATTARVGAATITRFELAQVAPIPATRDVIRRTLEAAGVEFLDDDGVRLKPRTAEPAPIEA